VCFVPGNRGCQESQPALIYWAAGFAIRLWRPLSFTGRVAAENLRPRGTSDSISAACSDRDRRSCNEASPAVRRSSVFSKATEPYPARECQSPIRRSNNKSSPLRFRKDRLRWTLNSDKSYPFNNYIPNNSCLQVNCELRRQTQTHDDRTKTRDASRLEVFFDPTEREDSPRRDHLPYTARLSLR